jgi:integrase
MAQAPQIDPRRDAARPRADCFARINAALKMKVENLRPHGVGWTVRLHEKGGKQHSMPCHHALAEALRAYIDAVGIAEDRKGWLFRTSRGHGGTVLSEKCDLA